MCHYTHPIKGTYDIIRSLVGSFCFCFEVKSTLISFHAGEEGGGVLGSIFAGYDAAGFLEHLTNFSLFCG